MTRQEFLEELRIALQGGISQGLINEHLQYYDNYIMEEARKGKTEQQVIEELGSPRLIARTLIDTADVQHKEFGETSHSDSGSGNGKKREEQASKGFRADYSQEKGWDIRYGRFRFNSWYGKLLLILTAILILVIIANVVAFLLPIVIPVVLILLILSLLFGSKR